MSRKRDSPSKPAMYPTASPKVLVHTVRYDALLVKETDGPVERFKEVRSAVLLLGGSKSAPYLKRTLDALTAVLPDVQRVELSNEGHLAPDNSGHPGLVARELRRFFKS
jgi:hypothetical protein